MDFGDDPVGIARVPCQAGQQVAAPDFQLRFARLPGTGYAVGGEQGCSPIVTKVERRPGGAEHHPGLDTGSCHGRDAGRRGQELACCAVPAGGDPPAGEQGGQLPPRVRLLATERPGQRGADVGLFGGKPIEKACPFGAAVSSATTNRNQPGPATYEFVVAFPTADMPALTALIRQAYDSGDALGMSVAGKLWQAPQPRRRFNALRAEQINLLSRNQAFQLYRLLVPSD